MSKIELTKVKLIIWDLDETLWTGTLSEGDIALNPKCDEFIRRTTDAGIMHSICSKNDFEKTKAELEKLKLWDLFVFPSIDWTSKGNRINSIIEGMGLRNVNVVFLDDNHQNRKEAEYYCPGIIVASPIEIEDLYRQSTELNLTDVAHKRLKQYKILEEKSQASKAFSSNEDFLKSCDIQVEIKHDVSDVFDRIHELVLRTNQLNYTKVRSTKEELSSLIADKSVNAGYVCVKDKFGDYGIVGFYAIKGNRLVHYCFSCRTLGMLVEQWVYIMLGCPEIEVVPEVVTQLHDNYLPPWINQSGKYTVESKMSTNGKILIKGPCDMDQMFSFIKQTPKIITEFSYTADNGAYIIGLNHTAQIVTAISASDKRKREIIEDSPWFDYRMLKTRLVDGKFDYVVISLLADSVLGVYKRKATGEMIALEESNYDLTDPQNWEQYINEEIYTGKVKFTKESLTSFSEKYTYVNNCDASVTLESLEYIYRYLDRQTKLILILGSEVPHKNNQKESYKGKAEYHALMNGKIRNWAKGKENIVLVELGKYIKSQADYMDTINHFTKRVYYDMAKDLVSITNTDVRMKNNLERGIDKLRYVYRMVIRTVKQ